jgi:RNA polymerase sigma-70 factor, ECF subfamily
MSAAPPQPLSASFLSHAPALLAYDAAQRPWLEATIGELLDTARAAWPQIQLDPDEFVAFLAQRVDGDVAMESIAAADLYLAAACLGGDSRALSVLDELIDKAAARLRLDASDPASDEVRQTARVKLLMRKNDAPPGLASFKGRGPLLNWLQVVLARTLLDSKRISPREVPTETPDTLLDTRDSVSDPEIAFLRERYRDEFKAAFEHALAALSQKERGVLRLHVVNDMSIDRIAACCSIGRSTAARWLAAIREKLLENTRQRLADALGLRAPEAASLVRALRSDLDPSINRLLSSHGPSRSSPGSK